MTALNCTDLDNLLNVLQTLDLEHVDITSLPTFGGSEPNSTLGVWSWDPDRLLVGTCADDFEIVDRADYE